MSVPSVPKETYTADDIIVNAMTVLQAAELLTHHRRSGNACAIDYVRLQAAIDKQRGRLHLTT
jgi:hypothetical protein